jgi:hypothetical protein
MKFKITYNCSVPANEEFYQFWFDYIPFGSKGIFFCSQQAASKYMGKKIYAESQLTLKEMHNSSIERNYGMIFRIERITDEMLKLS